MAAAKNGSEKVALAMGSVQGPLDSSKDARALWRTDRSTFLSLGHRRPHCVHRPRNNRRLVTRELSGEEVSHFGINLRRLSFCLPSSEARSAFPAPAVATATLFETAPAAKPPQPTAPAAPVVCEVPPAVAELQCEVTPTCSRGLKCLVPDIECGLSGGLRHFSIAMLAAFRDFANTSNINHNVAGVTSNMSSIDPCSSANRCLNIAKTCSGDSGHRTCDCWCVLHSGQLKVPINSRIAFHERFLWVTSNMRSINS